jgi:hypothetical protein
MKNHLTALDLESVCNGKSCHRLCKVVSVNKIMGWYLGEWSARELCKSKMHLRYWISDSINKFRLDLLKLRFREMIWDLVNMNISKALRVSGQRTGIEPIVAKHQS